MKDCVECEKQDRAAKLRAARLPCQENKQETRTFMSVYTIAKRKNIINSHAKLFLLFDL
jgi:hypothetical protein